MNRRDLLIGGLAAPALLWGAAARGEGPAMDGPAMEGPAMADRDLIVLAAPRADDPYYADHREAIVDFQIAFARAAAPYDDALVLADAALAPRYADALGPRAALVAPQDDIWVRDYAPAIPGAPTLFRYTAAGQGGGARGQRDADAVQARFRRLLDRAAVAPRRADLLNDGGNLVEDGEGRAVVSRKFLRDNGLSEAAARRAFRALAGLSAVAFIEADEQGGLEHADGVAAFVAPGVLVANAYPDDPVYEAQLLAALRDGLPGVAVHTIPAPYDGSAIVDPRFGSACWLYANLLTTRSALYLPAFGLAEDAAVARQIAALTPRAVVAVRSETVFAMGGGVRCLSWRVTGAAADRLRRLAG